MEFLEKCLSIVQQKLEKNDNSSNQYKIFETLLKRKKKFKQRIAFNTLDTHLDTPAQCETTDKVLLLIYTIKKILNYQLCIN